MLTPDHAKHLDSSTVAFYLSVPKGQIVLLQTFFELYDGVGTVRTLPEEGLLCVFTTPTLVDDCIGVLNAIREQVEWRVSEGPATDYLTSEAN